MDATIAQGQLNDANESLDNEIPVPAKRFDRSKRFWAIIATLALAALLSSLENSVVTTALPFIVTKLDLGADYIWVTNAFFLTAYAFPTFPGAREQANSTPQNCGPASVWAARQHLGPKMGHLCDCLPLHPRERHLRRCNERSHADCRESRTGHWLGWYECHC